jgi:hypothetical protein
VIDRIKKLELDIDCRLVDLWAMADEVPEWSLELTVAYMRAAYGQGYMDSLREDVRGRLCKEHGYRLPSRRET